MSRINLKLIEKVKLLLIRRGYSFYRSQMKATRIGRFIGRLILKSGFVNAIDLHISRLSNDKLFKRNIDHCDALLIEAEAGIPGFHLSEPLNLEVSKDLAKHPHINILLPSLLLKHMSGGPNTALLFAALLVESGERVRLFACDAPAEGKAYAVYDHIDSLLQRPVIRENIELVDAFDRTQATLIGVNDLFFATAWWTAQIAKYAIRKTFYKKFVYLIQDFEPILHDGSTFQARALETYGLPHIPLINTRLLLDHLVKEGAGCYSNKKFVEESIWFEPALDRKYFFPDPNVNGKSAKKTLLFYARPTLARRNLFEMGVVALRQAVASGAIDKESWNVWAVGEKIPPIALGGGLILNPLPWMSFAEYAECMRSADLMLSLMLSPHPSYPPLEMAASGKLVVTNSFSVKNAERLRHYSPNIIVAEPTSESIAAALERVCTRINVGFSTYDPFGAVSLPTSWDESLSEILPTLMQKINILRASSSSLDRPVLDSYSNKAKTDYEFYRMECLSRRRSEGPYQQEPGLISFVTSAYNTEVVFLEEIGRSVLQQDGGIHFEWLILDNGSTNHDTCEALKKLATHRGVRLERVECNLGIVGGMRFCLENAQGRYIIPLDSDDLIEPDCVHVLTRFIMENNYPPVIYTDEDKLGSGYFGSPYFKSDWDPVLFLHSCYIAHLCVIDRELGIKLDLYSDKTAEGCHDWDSFIRFTGAGYIPCHIPEVLYSWRIHEASTSGNIASKSYITESHRATLQRALKLRSAKNLELVSSPLFNCNVDWWYRRRRDAPVSCISIAIETERSEYIPLKVKEYATVIDADKGGNLLQLLNAVTSEDEDLVHLCWNGVIPDDDEWRFDSAGLLELFTDAVMVGGTLHDGVVVVDGPRNFGFGSGYECPDRGRPLGDPGYSAMMWKARSVSAVSSGHCVVRRDFLLEVLPKLIAENVSIEMLGPWLGAIAMRLNKRIIFSPFMRAKVSFVPEELASEQANSYFLSIFWRMFPDKRFYSQRLGLTRETAYLPVSNAKRDNHLRKLQLHTLHYADWFVLGSRQRLIRYPTPEQSLDFSIITPVYHGSDLELLDQLSNVIVNQSKPALEWLIIVNGPMAKDSMDIICAKAKGEWNARLIVETNSIGIVASLRLGLEAAKGDYVITVDADDLITQDAIQILAHEINRLGRPDLVYTDEDLLVENTPSLPNLRADFDPVLHLDNSTIWHLCAMKRGFALEADVYGDSSANWCQDWDTISRIFYFGGRIAHLPEVLYHWRQHSGSTTNKPQGDTRTLDSVRHILERHIERTANPKRFFVADWPESRGSRELYISLDPKYLPKFIWIGDISIQDSLVLEENSILVIASNGLIIESNQTFFEVARLFELHPQVDAIGGMVVDSNNIVVDACNVINSNGYLESPWLGNPASSGGPYSLLLKPQTVTTTGNSLAFFRISKLKQINAWPVSNSLDLSDEVMRLCEQITENNGSVAFSPLVRGRASAKFRIKKNIRRPPSRYSNFNNALVRYGLTCDFN